MPTADALLGATPDPTPEAEKLLRAEVVEVGATLRVSVPSLSDKAVDVDHWAGAPTVGDEVLLAFDEDGTEWLIGGNDDYALRSADNTFTGANTFEEIVDTEAGIRIGGDRTLIENANGHIESNTFLRLKVDTFDTIAPELHFKAKNSYWLIGVDVANNGGAKDFVIAAKKDPEDGAVNDVIYLANNDDGATFHPVTVGVGITPPNNEYRLQVGTNESHPELGNLRLRKGASQTGHILLVEDSGGTDRVWLDSSTGYAWRGMRVSSTAASVTALAIQNNAASSIYGIEYSGNALRFANYTTGKNFLRFDTDGGVAVIGDKIGFFTTNPVTKETGVAVTAAAIHAALVRLGLIAA